MKVGDYYTQRISREQEELKFFSSVSGQVLKMLMAAEKVAKSVSENNTVPVARPPSSMSKRLDIY